MNDAQKKSYLAWLNDAHAMEEGLITVLKKQIEEVPVGMETVKSRLEEHLEETRRHGEMVHACIERNGGDTSAVKDFVSKTMSTINGLTMSMMDDVLVKNMHASYAAEHFEIASYMVIRSAAEELGDTEGIAMCDAILEEEERMSEWILEQIPVVTTKYVATL